MIRIAKALVGALIVAATAGCGTRQPVEAGPKVEPLLHDGRTCPSPTVGANVSITSAIGEASSPVTVFDGEKFAVAWWDMREKFPRVNAAMVGRDGAFVTEPRILPHERAAKEQSLAADSAEIHAVWMDDGVARSARLTSAEPVATQISPSASAATAGPRGAVAWVEQGALLFRSDEMLPPPDRSGARPEPPPALVYKGGIEDPAVAWNGAQYAIAWSSSVKGGRDILLQRMSAAGARLGKPVKVSGIAGLSRNPEIAALRDGFAVVWTNAAPEADNPRDRYRIFFAVVGAKGDGPRLTRQLEFNGSADHVAIAAAGGEYGLAWVGSVEPMGSAVFFARLDAQGVPRGETIRVSEAAALTCGRPSLAFAGDGYGVTWHDDRDPVGSKILFSFLACGAPEPEAPATPATPAPPEPPKPDEPTLKKLFE